MTIQVGLASSAHREKVVGEFHVLHDGVIAIHSEIYDDDEKLMIAICSRKGRNPWEFPYPTSSRRSATGLPPWDDRERSQSKTAAPQG